MADEKGVRNEVSASSVGAVVQAGTINHLVVSGPQWDVAIPVPRQLPPVVRDFAGRRSELAALDRLLTTKGVATVDGTAGVGKTTLAVFWARRVESRFPDGTLFADLRGHGPSEPVDPILVMTSFLRALGVPAERIPPGLDAQTGLYRSLLAARNVLVLLDNAVAADQVRPLLPVAAGCVAVITSRASLTGLVVTAGADRVSLSRFTRAESDELVRGIVGERRADAEPDALGDLIHVCARLPLALRIAATRIADQPWADIADLVADISEDDDQLAALSGTGDEQSAVRPVFDWSYNRLSADLAQVFRYAGAHVSPEFSVDAAAALTGLTPRAVRRKLETLADLHLLESVGHRRYRMHDLLRAYAAQRTENPEPRQLAVTRLLTWYAQTAMTADGMVFPGKSVLAADLGPEIGECPITDRVKALEWLDLERPALLAALDHAASHGLHEITAALASTVRFLAFHPRSLWPARVTAESHGLVAARATGNRDAETLFLLRRADSLQMMGHWAESGADLAAAKALAKLTGDLVRSLEVLCGLGLNQVLQGCHGRALGHFEAALPLARQTGNKLLEAIAECNLSQIKTRLGRFGEALAHAQRESVLRRLAGTAVGEAYALHNQAMAWQGLGDHAQAIDLAERAVSTYRAEPVAERYLAAALETIANSRAALGDQAGARQSLQEAVDLLTALGEPRAAELRDRL